MIDKPPDNDKILPLTSKSEPVEELPYRVELWDGEAVERVLARAFNATLAHAIFKAASEEHPSRRITLKRGERVIADSNA